VFRRQIKLLFAFFINCMRTRTNLTSTGPQNEIKRTSQGKQFSGESANAVPHTQKLRRGVAHIWGNPRGQLNRSAMEEPRPRGATFMIIASSRPGKYADLENQVIGYPTVRESCCSRFLHWIITKRFFKHSTGQILIRVSIILYLKLTR